MADTSTVKRPRVVDVIQQYGKCVELVSLDPHFHEISVGLYVKDGTATVWTFSRKPGVEQRIEKIRDQLVVLGGMVPVEGTHNQARYACRQLHRRPTMFLVMQAVEKDPGFSHPEGAITVKDLRSPLTLRLEPSSVDGRWVYTVTADGEAKIKARRLLVVASGLVRYGEMEKLDNNHATFPCGYRHDELARLVLPYARNVSGVESALETSAMRGQMTTGTLGFSPPT